VKVDTPAVAAENYATPIRAAFLTGVMKRLGDSEVAWRSLAMPFGFLGPHNP
jgi:hypothetical protein